MCIAYALYVQAQSLASPVKRSPVAAVWEVLSPLGQPLPENTVLN